MSEPLKTYSPLRANPITSEDLRKFTQEELDQIADALNAVIDLLSSGGDGGVPLLNPVDWIQFNQRVIDAGITPPANEFDPDAIAANPRGTRRGLMWWNDGETDQNLQCYTDDPDFAMRLGREVVYRCGWLAGPGASMARGTVVRVLGAFPALGAPIVTPAQANAVPTSQVLGLVAGTFQSSGDAEGGAGYVMAFGTVFKVDTSQDSDGNPLTGANNGNVVYLSAKTAGGWTIIDPASDPSVTNGVSVRVGILTRAGSATEGLIAVAIERASELNRVLDVDTATRPAQSLDALAWDASRGRWVPSGVHGLRACEFIAPGNGAGDLTPSSSFNVDNYVTPGNAPLIDHVSTGLYEVTLATPTLYGFNLLDFCVPMVVVASDTANPDAGAERLVKLGNYLPGSANPGAGTFRFEVYTLETSTAGAGVRVIKTLADLTADDEVVCAVRKVGPAADEDV